MNKRFIFLLGILIVLIFVAIYQHSVKFVYVNPLVKTSVLNDLAPSVSAVDKVISSAIKECKKDYPDMKVAFQNAYGSGFLEFNDVPNDLDYSVNVNLGTFNYNGNNTEDVASDIYERIERFQTEVYSYMDSMSPKDLYTNKSTFEIISRFAAKSKINKYDIVNSIDSVFKDKDYVFYSKKQMEENIVIDYPFIMKSNEMLIEDLEPISLFSRKVRYNKNQKKFLREVTISMDYSCVIKNEKTGQEKAVDIVAEAFIGQRLQLARRFFVPSVFVNSYSANYLKNLPYRVDDEEFFENRMDEYGRMLQIISNLAMVDDRPVKMLKRYLQCADIISPALDKETLNDINTTISQDLNSEDISLINDYSTILSNFSKVLESPKLYQVAMSNNDVKEMLNIAENSLTKLHEHNLLVGDDYQKLLDFHKNILTSIGSIHSRDDLYKKYSWFIKYRNDEILPIEAKVANKSMKNLKKISSYTTLFEKIYTDAGFHKVDLYWLDKNKLGIIKDDFTKTINEKDLHKVAIENNLVDVDYVFVDKKDVDNYRVRYSVWLRHNPTVEQQENYEKLKAQIISDKKNYTVKRRIIL